MPPGALARKISARNSQLLFGRIVSSGDWDAATAVPPATAQDGQFWKATSAGTYGGATIPNGALCLFSENLTVVHYLVQEAGAGGGGDWGGDWDMSVTSGTPTFPLDMPELEVIDYFQANKSVTVTSRADLSVGGHTATVTLAEGAAEVRAAVSTKTSNGSVGKKVFGFRFTFPALSSSPSEIVSVSVMFDSPTSQVLGPVVVQWNPTTELWTSSTLGGLEIPNGSIFGGVIDAVAGTFTVAVDNTVLASTSSAYPDGLVAYVAITTENIHASSVGKVVGVEFVVDPSEFSGFTWAAGAGAVVPLPVALPAGAAEGKEYRAFPTGGTYAGLTVQSGDVVQFVDGTTSIVVTPGTPGASSPDAVTSVNGQTGDVVITSPVTSVNGQTGNVTITTPTIDGTSGTIATKKRPAAFGMVFNTHYTLNGFTERHVVGNPAYSFSPKFNQGGGVATPKISADASWGLFRANRYTSNSSFVNELFAVDLFTGTTTRVAAGTGIHVFSAVASADGTTIYMGTTQAGEARAYKRNADGGYSHIGGFNTRYLTTDNRRIIRASDTQLGQATPTYIYAGYTLSTPSNVIIRATVSNWTTTPITISALANVRDFSVSPDSDHIFAKAIDGTVWMGKADGVTAVALPASISGTVLSAVFQRPGIHQSRINQYKMAVQWDDAGTIKLSIVNFEIGYGGVQSIYSSTDYTVDTGDLLAGGGFSVCGTYVSGEYKVIDVLTGTEVLNQGGGWVG